MNFNNKDMKRAIRRHRTAVKARRKFLIIRDVMQWDNAEDYVFGKLRKGKIHCSCGLCKYEKVNHIEKPKYIYFPEDL